MSRAARGFVVVLVGAGLAVVGGSGVSAGPDVAPASEQDVLDELSFAAGAGLVQGAEAPSVEIVEQSPGAQSVPSGGGTATVTPTLTLVEGRVQVTLEMRATGLEDRRASAKVRAEVCPDGEGRVSGSVTVTVVDTVIIGEVPTTSTSDGSFSGVVNDSATLARIEVENEGSDDPGTGAVTKWTSKSTTKTKAEAKGKVKAPTTKVTRRGSQTKKQARQRAARQHQLVRAFAERFLRDAELLWRSGYCVEIDVTKGQSGTVKPKEKVEIEAEPRSRFDHTTIDAPISAKLTAGKKKIDPKVAPSPPARFTYTGPDTTGESGTVELRSVSRRGIGTTTLIYDTAADLRVDATAAAGDAPATHFTGTKCGGPAGTWTLQLQFTAPVVGLASGELTFTLDPQTLSGPITGQSGLGFAISGTVSYDPATSILTTTGQAGGLPGTFTIPVQKGSFC